MITQKNKFNLRPKKNKFVCIEIQSVNTENKYKLLVITLNIIDKNKFKNCSDNCRF